MNAIVFRFSFLLDNNCENGLVTLLLKLYTLKFVFSSCCLIPT